MEKLVCGECGNEFERPGGRGPIPTRCADCKRERRRVKHAEQERDRLERRRRGEYRCGHCQEIKAGAEFAPTQLRDGGWCRDCFRDTYVERSGGLVARTCESCPNTFEVTRRSKRKFCSRRCKDRASQKRESARLLDTKRGRPCANECGREIPPSKLASARYCSEQCRREHVGAEIRRRSMLKRTYGLTPEYFDRLLLEQQGRCAICESEHPGTKGIWHVDHCHEGGHVRGLLCSACNTGLGQFKDRPDVLRRAADYLEANSGG